MNLFCCADDFFLDGNFEEIKEYPKTPRIQDVEVQKLQNQTMLKEEKDTLFGTWKKNRKEKQAQKAKSINDMPKGYYGTLPDIYRDFKYKKKTPSTPKDTDLKAPTLEELDEEEFQEAPFSDTLFLDNIIKKEKTSDYINNLQKVKYALTKLKEALEEESAQIQKINASINVFDLYVMNLKIKYENQKEANLESYKELLLVDYQAKVFGNLLFDSAYYSKIIPVQDGKYSANNLEVEKKKLLNKVNKVLFLIIEEKA